MNEKFLEKMFPRFQRINLKVSGKIGQYFLLLCFLYEISFKGSISKSWWKRWRIRATGNTIAVVQKNRRSNTSTKDPNIDEIVYMTSCIRPPLGVPRRNHLPEGTSLRSFPVTFWEYPLIFRSSSHTSRDEAPVPTSTANSSTQLPHLGRAQVV